MCIRIRKPTPPKPARAAASTSSKMARISPPSKSSKALPTRPTTLSRRFSKTADSCATKLSLKLAPSPLPTTPTMILSDRFRFVVFRGGPWPARFYSRAAQFEALNFPRHGLRQLATESYFARHFVRYEPRFDVLANFRRQLFRSFTLRAQYHVRHGIAKSTLINRADHGGFGDVGVPQQRVLHLHRRNPHARNFQHVVRASAVVVVTVRITKELIAGHHPRSAFRACRQFGNPPILRKRARATHPEIADLAVTHRFSRVIHDLDFVTRHGKTATPWLAFSGNTRNENMQHLRRANSVEDLDSELPLPRVENLRGQRFAGRYAFAH